MENKRAVGTIYEQKAGAYLESLGYEILEYNWRCKKGEIDIIARDGEYLVFCEVKYRTDNRAGHPLEAVDARKQRVISACAFYYLTTHHMLNTSCRFDVVGVLGEEIQLVKNAFPYCG